MRPRGGVYYGRRIVGVSFLTQCLTVGCVFYSFGVFFTPLLDEFGWTRAQLAWGFSSVSVYGALVAPAIGRLVDRWGPRSLTVMGLSAVLLHQVPLLIDAGVSPGRTAFALGATAGVGEPLVGWLRDRTGGYDLAIVLMATLSLLAAASISRLRPAIA